MIEGIDREVTSQPCTTNVVQCYSISSAIIPIDSMILIWICMALITHICLGISEMLTILILFD